MLIYDFGMHTGADTDFYLAKGATVIGLEPNPDLANAVRERLSTPIASAKLIIVEAALAMSEGRADFYIANNTEFSSLDRWRAEASGSVRHLAVRTVTLSSLVQQFGMPHYIKCDIEGADEMFCRQLLTLKELPQYVSVEGIALEWLALLSAAGYTRFKLINQAWVRRMTPTIGDWQFSGASSGPFGEDTPGPWLTFSEAAQRWLDFDRLKRNDPLTVLDNWFDFHAAR